MNRDEKHFYISGTVQERGAYGSFYIDVEITVLADNEDEAVELAEQIIDAEYHLSVHKVREA